MPYEFKIVRRVEFFETDMAGLMHFSNFFRYMESVEVAFFRSLGLSIVRGGEPPVGWPRVHAECDYRAPLFFDDEVEVHLLVAEIKAKSITYLYKFRKLSAAPPFEVARGRIVAACVTKPPGGRMKSHPIPQTVLDKIQIAPSEMLD